MSARSFCARAAFSFCFSTCLCLSSVKADKPVTAENGPAVSTKPVSVEMFQAMKDGTIEVKLVPKDSSGGNVLITNKSDKPLTIKLPEAFAGVPVLAQAGGRGRGAGGAGGMGGGMMQGVGGGMGGGMGGMGGGMGGMGGGGMGGGGGGGFFNVGPEKVGKIKVMTVCLEHGKQEPNMRVTYDVRPIETVTDKPEVAQLCKMVGNGEVSQNAAQAAVWNIANGLTWEELMNKDKAKHLDGSSEKYFSVQEIQQAHNIKNESIRRGKENPLPTKPTTETPSKENSLSAQK
jgi:hypothetical protein